MSFLRKTEEPAHERSAHDRHTTAEDVRQAFDSHREELKRLALLLVGDPELAEVCVVDACALATRHDMVFENWLERWARRATIRCGIEMHHSRIAQLALSYERKPCRHGEHGWLTEESVALLEARAGEMSMRMDVLCRAALLLRGVERCSPLDAALTLGVSKTVVEAAYCAALDSLRRLRDEALAARSDYDRKNDC